MKDIRKILNTIDNEVELGERAVEIDAINESKEMRAIVKALKDTLNANNLASLSAKAIGENRRIFCIKFQEEIKTFINPIIANAKGLQLSRESSVLIPNQEFLVPRNNDIMVMYTRPMGKIETRQLVGLAAIVFQQMMNQLDGVFLSDIGLPVGEEFDSMSEEDRNELISEYLDSLDIQQKEVDKEIQEDEELKKMNDAIEFMASVKKGETKLEQINNQEGKIL